MRYHTLYVHIMPNNKKYFGITQQSVEDRWGNNGCKYSNNKYFYNAIQKYGWDSIQHIVLADNLSKEWACKLEQDLIWKYKSNEHDFGYNLANGGEINRGWHYSHSQETKDKLSKIITEWHKKPETVEKLHKAHKGRKFTEEHRKKLSDAHKGKPSKRKGTKVSEESRKRMSEAQKGKIISEWQRKRISEANRGKIVSEETRKKLSLAHIGKPSAKKGKRVSEETRLKMIEAQRRRRALEKGRYEKYGCKIIESENKI